MGGLHVEGKADETAYGFGLELRAVEEQARLKAAEEGAGAAQLQDMAEGKTELAEDPVAAPRRAHSETHVELFGGGREQRRGVVGDYYRRDVGRRRRRTRIVLLCVWVVLILVLAVLSCYIWS